MNLRAVGAIQRWQKATVAIVAALSLFVAVIGGWVLQSAHSADIPPQLPAVSQQAHDVQSQEDADVPPANCADEGAPWVEDKLFKSTRVKRDRPPASVQVRPAGLGISARDARFDGTDADIGPRDILTYLCVARR